MPTSSVNLNLLPLLRALLTLRSVTRAGRSLGISQSAASQGLARLRVQMKDPLLVQISGKMELTPLATALALRVGRLADELDDLFLPSEFDPGTAQRSLVVAANDYMVNLVGRPVLDLLRQEAPGIAIHFIEFGPDFLERMAAQEIDFALLPRFVVRDLTVAPLRYRTLLVDQPAVLMDRAHPLAGRAIISEADIAACDCAAFFVDAFERIPSKHWKAPPEVAPFWDMMPRIVVRANHFTAIPALLEDTELITLLPYQVGLALCKVWPMVTRRISFGPTAVEHGLAWSPVFDADPGHSWFRTEIERRLAGARTTRSDAA